MNVVKRELARSAPAVTSTDISAAEFAAQGWVPRTYVCSLGLQFALSMNNLVLSALLPMGETLQRMTAGGLILLNLCLGVVCAVQFGRVARSWHVWLGAATLAGYCIVTMYGVDYPSGVSATVALLSVSTLTAILAGEVLGVRGLADILRWACLILCAGSLIIALVVPSIGVLHTWQHDGYWRGVFANKNGLGYAASLLVALSVAQCLFYRSTAKWWAAAAFGLFMASLAHSRGAIVIALLVAVFAVALRLRVQRALFVCLAAGLLLTLAFVQIAQIPWEIRQDHVMVGDLTLFLNRSYIWSYALELFEARPLFGYGLGGAWAPDRTFVFLARYNWVLDNFHSGYLRVLVELGIVGFALFMVMVIATFAKSAFHLRARPDMSLASTIMLFVILANVAETYFLRATDTRQFILTAVAVSIWAATGITRQMRAQDR